MHPSFVAKRERCPTHLYFSYNVWKIKKKNVDDKQEDPPFFKLSSQLLLPPPPPAHFLKRCTDRSSLYMFTYVCLPWHMDCIEIKQISVHALLVWRAWYYSLVSTVIYIHSWDLSYLIFLGSISPGNSNIN